MPKQPGENPTQEQVTAPNGVAWTRAPGGTTSGHQLLEALNGISGIYGDVPRRWNWWEEGRQRREHDRHMAVLEEWDNGAEELPPDESEARMKAWSDDFDKRYEEERRRRAQLAADTYDEERASQRLQYLRDTADAAFFGHVLRKPANAAQRDGAARREAEARASAAELLHTIGDPEQVIDKRGYLPSERRATNLGAHTDYWRHRLLREWSTKDRRQFNALLKMPPPSPDDMCSECEAPAEWHEYDISVRLFHPPPAPGSQAEKIAQLMPGWWERCPACTAYRIGHVWGGSHALPDFDGGQWVAMLPPLLRTLFTSEPPKARKKRAPKPKPLATIPPGPIDEVMARLAEAKAAHPDAEVRTGAGGVLELWNP
ncbi:hypothetical protein [Pseudonocardia xishanensis]|uniref:Uncharacterized protein n=1 Tax=Pseudonocardia xishanensis TaxID=630995 RepID=A0ABP8S4V4_9PSEU